MESAKKHEIVNLIGKNCITKESGKILYDIIIEELRIKNNIELDFTGVGVYASPFFNAAIGPLFKDFDRNFLKLHLSCNNMTPVGESVFELVMDNSERYYNDQKFRNDLTEVLREQEEEQ